MSRCYPFPPPGYKKAPQPSVGVAQPSVDVAQPHKDKKDKHKHKDKKKKKKKDGDANGDSLGIHDTDSSRPSKQPRTALINDILQTKSKEEKQNGKVRDVPSTAVTERPIIPSTSALEPSIVIKGKGKVRDGGETSASARGVSERTPVNPPVNPPVIPLPVASVIPPQPLYSKQEPNGKPVLVAHAKPDLLVLPPKSSGNEPSSSSRPGRSNSNQPTLPSNNLDSQRQSLKAPELLAYADCEMMALREASTWSDVPDEDWLFAGRPSLGSHPKPKAEVERGAGEPSLQVWAEAVFLPSVEIHALPYVVPY